MLALKVQRELERRLAAVFGTTAQDPKAVTVSEALTALGRLSFLIFDVDQKNSTMRLPKPDQHQRTILDALTGTGGASVRTSAANPASLALEGTAFS